jgi:lipoprotein-anchoring transpeptidase ErfK/SrfK
MTLRSTRPTPAPPGARLDTSRSRAAARMLVALVAAGLVACMPARAQSRSSTTTSVRPEPGRGLGAPAPIAIGDTVADSSYDAIPHYKDRADSLTAVRTAAAAAKAKTMRVVVSLAERTLWVMSEGDTLLSAPVAVGMRRSFEYGGRSWKFETPRGVRVVKRKRADAEWKPPEWHYAEVAREHGLKLASMPTDKPVSLKDGRQLAVRDSLVGLLHEGGIFAALPTDEHIVFDSTLFVPPLSTKNRRIEGELGRYQLDMGNGYLLHGTPREHTIGTATTHGCVRLREEDITWLYENIPVGTRVYIY